MKDLNNNDFNEPILNKSIEIEDPDCDEVSGGAMFMSHNWICPECHVMNVYSDRTCTKCGYKFRK